MTPVASPSGQIIGVNIQINNHTIEDQLVTAQLEKVKANLPVQLEDPDTGMIKVSDKSIDFFSGVRI